MQVVGGDVVGYGFTECEHEVVALTLDVELFKDGFEVASNVGYTVGLKTVPQGGEDDPIRVQAPCTPGLWVVILQTLFVAPPGYVPAAGIIYTPVGGLFPTYIGAKDCLPVIINMSDSDARTKIAQLGLRVGTVTHQPSDAARDSVISSSLRADDTTVDLVEAAGTVTVPNMIGGDERAAGRALQSSGLVMGSTSRNNYPDVTAGIVAAQNPAPGSVVPWGSRVNIAVSLGPEGGDPGGGGCFAGVIC